MVESLILVEGRAEQGVDEDALRSVSLANAKPLVVGHVPGGAVVLHLAANTLDDLQKALLEVAKLPGVGELLTLMLRTVP